MTAVQDPTDQRRPACPIQILLLTGSTREPSYTRALTEQVDTTLIALGSRTTHWRLGESPLPIADPRFHHDPATHVNEVVRSLVAQADAADAFVLSTPVYHNSYSGALKNALDHLAIAQFHYKPVGLVSHGGHRSTQAVDQLRLVVRGLFGVAIPAQVCTAQEDFQHLDAATYQLSSTDTLRRTSSFASELMLFAHQLRLMREAASGLGVVRSARSRPAASSARAVAQPSHAPTA